MTSAPTFLIVDDDADSRYLTQCALAAEFAGCRVIESATIQNALAITKENRLDAVLTDHHLGPEDGTAFIARMRTSGVDCPVIMVTGSSDPRIHERALAAGASRVFLNWESEYLGYLRELIAESGASDISAQFRQKS